MKTFYRSLAFGLIVATMTMTASAKTADSPATNPTKLIPSFCIKTTTEPRNIENTNAKAKKTLSDKIILEKATTETTWATVT